VVLQSAFLGEAEGSCYEEGMAANSPIPLLLVEPLRAALVSQGFPRETVTNSGQINPAGLLAGSYDTLEIRTAITPPIIIDTRSLLIDNGKRNPLLDAVKPTIILRGNGGVNVIAPYGPAPEGGMVVPLFIIGALIGIGVLIGRVTA